MPFYQCNSSGRVKRYVDEVSSDWVRVIVDPASANIVSIADITRAEVTSAFARRAREGIITQNLSNAIRYRLMTQCSWLPPVSSINR
jgi:CRP-like cAMP-binding protein